jgi:hypothetical protein
MKQITFLLIFLFFTNFGICQQKEGNNKKELTQILTDFMGYLVKKDSVKFYALFHEDPIIWVGVIKEKSHQEDLKKDQNEKNYFSSTYRQFYRSISNLGANEEKFYNIDIKEDGSIASVTFDYSFCENKKKINWGQESWGLIKINGQWKIVSVIFSLEFENINSEPKRLKQK